MRIIFFLIFFLSISLQAQDRGRLDNGAAYRTDNEGNQIVDYIAELEVENDALRRRIGGLENEVESLARSAGAGSRQPLRERNVTHGTFEQSNTRPGTTQVAKQKCPLLTCGENECQTFISEIESRNQSVLDKQMDDLRQLKIENERCNEQFASFQTTLSDKEGAVQATNQQLASQISLNNELRSQIATKEREISQMRANEENLRRANLELQGKVQSLTKASNVAPPKTIEKPQMVRASARKEVFNTPQTSYSQVSAEQRKALKGRINNVIALRVKRDKLFKSYTSKTIRVQKQPIMTRKGKKPEQLLKEVDTITSLRTLRGYESDVSKLLSRVKADIALIQRLQ